MTKAQNATISFIYANLTENIPLNIYYTGNNCRLGIVKSLESVTELSDSEFLDER